MRFWISSLILGLLGFVMFSGCSATRPGTWFNSSNEEAQVTEKKVVVEKVDREDIRQVMREEKLLTLNGLDQSQKVFGVTGEGIAPLNTISPAQAIALAKRAAMADAYRQLGAKLYGVRINAKDTIQDAALKDSRIEAQVNALIKNATITDTSYKDGLYRVTMELKMNETRWKEIFAY